MRPKPLGNDLLRPPHFPPPCETCAGYGYIQAGIQQLRACPDCRKHPGHTMTFAKWAEVRP